LTKIIIPAAVVGGGVVIFGVICIIVVLGVFCIKSMTDSIIYNKITQFPN
jgi:hypothetical protein